MSTPPLPGHRRPPRTTRAVPASARRTPAARRPVARPLPPEIYVRRRVAALVIILLVVALLLGAWVAVSGASKKRSEVAAAATTAVSSTLATSGSTAVSSAASTAASTAASSSASAAVSSAAGTAGSTPVNTAVAPVKHECALADLQITVNTDKPTYQSAVQPVFSMTVMNPTAVDCVINLNQDTLRFEVYDMGSNLKRWTDTDCSAPVQEGTETFKAGEKREFTATWSRLGSAPQQCQNRAPVAAGAYYAHAVIGNNASPAQPFNLL